MKTTALYFSVLLLCINVRKTASIVGEDFRTAVPDRILSNSRLTTLILESFPKRSMLVCYAACLNSETQCFSLSYDRLSTSCYLNYDVTANEVTMATGVVTIITSQKATLTELTTELTTEPTTEQTTEPEPIVCPDGYTRFQNECYKAEKSNQKSMAQSISFCQAASADLLSIESADEQEFIRLFLVGEGLTHNFWTSGRGTGSGSFEWIGSSTLLVYDNFATGVAAGNYDTNSCIYLKGPTRYKWYLDPCTRFNRVICEYPKTL